MGWLWTILHYLIGCIVIVVIVAISVGTLALPLVLLWESWRLRPRTRGRWQFRLSSLFFATAVLAGVLWATGTEAADLREPVHLIVFVLPYVLAYFLISLVQMFFWDALVGFDRKERSLRDVLVGDEENVKIEPLEVIEEEEDAQRPGNKRRRWWARRWPERYKAARSGKDHTVPLDRRDEDD